MDNVIFGFDGGELKVLLIERKTSPYLEQLALPGELVYPNEDLDDAPMRILEELTGLKNVFLEQVKTFGKVNRHPLGRVITVAYFSLIRIDTRNRRHLDEYADWYSVKAIRKSDLAFDHNEILETCFARLKQMVKTQPIGFELLPAKFTLSELRKLYESILETELEKRNFRKKIQGMNLLVDLDEYQEGVAHRPARLYRFDRKVYEQLHAEGFSFELRATRHK